MRIVRFFVQETRLTGFAEVKLNFFLVSEFLINQKLKLDEIEQGIAFKRRKRAKILRINSYSHNSYRPTRKNCY